MKYVSRGYRIFQVLNLIFMLTVILICLIPLVHIIALSFSDTTALLNKKVTVFPVGFNIEAYKMVLQQSNFIKSFSNSVLYTLTGTVISLFMTVICAYPLANKKLFGRGFLIKFIIFTMFFSAGLIPNYILISSLGFTDRIWSLVIPGAISQYYLIIVITFMQGIPESLQEAAAIDGLNPIQILLRIVLPLSKPILATIGLFVAVGQWNDWFNALIYLNSNERFPMMLYLRNIVQGAAIAVKDSFTAKGQTNVIGTSIKTATIMLVSTPIIIVYPFLQKYFVKGVMLGSIKG